MSVLSRVLLPAAGRDDAASTADAPVPEYLTWFAFAAGVAWAVHFLLAARGVEGNDPIAHFVISREAWHRPALMLHHWGRPVNTLLYMPSALLGLTAARVTSLVLAALTAVVTLRLAHRLQVQPAFVVLILFWFQPWSARWVVHPALSEIPFTLLMALSAYLFVSGHVLLASLVIGLLPLTRVEAIALNGLWVVYCIWRREWRAAGLAMLPLVVYVGLYRWVFGQLPGGTYPVVPSVSSGADLIARAGSHRPHAWVFVTALLSGVGLPAVCLALYGVPLIVRSVTRLAVLGWYASYVVVHMAAFAIGFVAALGGDQIRYLFPIAPGVSIAAALGLKAFAGQMGESIAELLGRRHQPRRLGSLVMAACLVLVLAAGLRQKPTPLDPEIAGAAATADWLRQQGMAKGPLVAPHIAIHYFLPGHLLRFWPGADPEALTKSPPLAVLPVGTIVVWDSHFSDDYGLLHKSLASERGRWRHLRTFEWDEGRFEVFRKEQP